MKTVIITGTGAGIGFELARIFSEKNYKVISLSRSSNVVELGLENINHMSFNITNDDDHLELVNYCKRNNCLLYTSPSPRDKRQSRMPSSA